LASVLAVITLSCSSLGAGTVQAADRSFVTEPGSGPDKWASAWLLRRFVGDATVLVAEAAAEAHPDAILFDAPGARYDRSGSTTTYSHLLDAFDIDDRVALQVGERVREIEIDAWRAEPSLESRVLEQAFRGMQLAFGREAVTQACYLRLFDAVAGAIADGALAGVQPASLQPDADCLDEGEPTGTALEAGRAVETLDLGEALRHIGDGADVVFVDTRERWEYDEGHVPGAINLAVRDIDAESAERLRGADLVIAYCVKDFRGYEAAKALGRLGVPAAIMNPHGLRGWIEAGLPVTGRVGAGVAVDDTTRDAPGDAIHQAMPTADDAVAALRRMARDWPADAAR